jgi:hypothetical protein
MRSASRAGSKPMGAKKVRASLLGEMLPLIQLPDQLIRIILSFYRFLLSYDVALL